MSTGVRWDVVEDPATHVRNVLDREAPDIPNALVIAYDWCQCEVALAELRPDRAMLERHDEDDAHVRRRDDFVELIRAGAPILPLIALGPGLRLVDGHARYRALRVLGVDQAQVLRQRTAPPRAVPAV